MATIVDMPLNSTPPPINPMELERKRTAVQSEAVIDCAHWSGLVNINLADLAPLHDAGLIGFKTFLDGYLLSPMVYGHGQGTRSWPVQQ